MNRLHVRLLFDLGKENKITRDLKENFKFSKTAKLGWQMLYMLYTVNNYSLAKFANIINIYVRHGKSYNRFQIDAKFLLSEIFGYNT